MFCIKSKRLKLIPLTNKLLQVYLNRPALEQALGLRSYNVQISPMYKAEVMDALHNFWLPKTLAHPHRYMWYTNWEIVLMSDNIAIGGIGFAGYPDQIGEAEIGYMICEQQQRNGYASEAIEAIVSWAFLHKNVHAIVAQTPIENQPSQKTLLKNGFKIVDERQGVLKFRLSKP